MAISFNSVPANLRAPIVAVEFDNSNAIQGPQLQPYRSLMIGPKLANGTGNDNERYLITSYQQAQNVFGAGSLLSEMCGKYLLNNTTNELWAAGMADVGVKAAGSIQLAGTTTAAGVLKLYISGKVAEVVVASGEAPATTIANLQAVIAADSAFLVDAAINVDTSILDLTAKNAGTVGDEIDLRMNYFDGDETPAGSTVTLVDMTGGTGNPDIDDVLTLLDDTQYLIIPMAFNDASNISKMETELIQRFGPLLQNDGYAQYGARGTLSELVTLGDSFNSQFTCIHRASGPTHPAEQVAAKSGVMNLNAQIDPARPFQTLEVLGILAESDDEKLTYSERNILLFNGIATDKVNDGNRVQIERVITTYKTNNAGADDPSYLDLSVLLTLSYIRYDWRNYILRKYPRHKLADDGTRFAAGQKIVTPKVMRAEAITKFEEWENIGLVEGFAQFKNDLITERNVSDRNRLDVLLPTDVINQLRVVGTKIGFLL